MAVKYQDRKPCLHCGKPTEKGEDFDTQYCAATWAEENDVPWFMGDLDDPERARKDY